MKAAVLACCPNCKREQTIARPDRKVATCRWCGNVWNWRELLHAVRLGRVA
jgi:ribosomal protein L37AE/L43A